MNTANLLLLAAYLENIPDDYEHFDMGEFLRDVDGTRCNVDAASQAKIASCGTVACALGHAPLLFPANADENWWSYCRRVFGLSGTALAWDWCFGSDWQWHDNTARGAAKRIRYLVEHGSPPADFESGDGEETWGEFVSVYA